MTADTLGQRLRAKRRTLKWSQARTASHLHLSRNEISLIERDIANATQETVKRVEALIGAAPPPPDDWRAVAIRLDTECGKLAALVQSLQAQLADERTICAWFEAAAFAAGDEVRALRDALRAEHFVDGLCRNSLLVTEFNPDCATCVLLKGDTC